MSKITHDDLTHAVRHRMLYSCLYLYGNSGRQRVKRRSLSMNDDNDDDNK